LYSGEDFISWKKLVSDPYLLYLANKNMLKLKLIVHPPSEIHYAFVPFDQIQEEFKDTKGVIRNSTSKKDREYNR
jgi:hypothetical protein